MKKENNTVIHHVLAFLVKNQKITINFLSTKNINSQPRKPFLKQILFNNNIIWMFILPLLFSHFECTCPHFCLKALVFWTEKKWNRSTQIQMYYSVSEKKEHLNRRIPIQFKLNIKIIYYRIWKGWLHIS